MTMIVVIVIVVIADKNDILIKKLCIIAGCHKI